MNEHTIYVEAKQKQKLNGHLVGISLLAVLIASHLTSQAKSTANYYGLMMMPFVNLAAFRAFGGAHSLLQLTNKHAAILVLLAITAHVIFTQDVLWSACLLPSVCIASKWGLQRSLQKSQLAAVAITSMSVLAMSSNNLEYQINPKMLLAGCCLGVGLVFMEFYVKANDIGASFVRVTQLSAILVICGAIKLFIVEIDDLQGSWSFIEYVRFGILSVSGVIGTLSLKCFDSVKFAMMVALSLSLGISLQGISQAQDVFVQSVLVVCILGSAAFYVEPRQNEELTENKSVKSNIFLYLLVAIIMVCIVMFSLVNHGFQIEQTAQFQTPQDVWSRWKHAVNLSLDVEPGKPLSKWDNPEKNRLPSYPFVSGDTFRSMADHIFDETDKSSFQPEKAQPMDMIFVKSDDILTWFRDMHPKVNVKYILFTHNSDYGFPQGGYGDASSYVQEPNLAVWCGQNLAEPASSKLVPFPIGLANRYWPHGDIHIMFSKYQQFKHLSQKSIYVYANFAADTNPARGVVIGHLNQLKNVTIVSNRKSWSSYLDDVSSSVYVISPLGNGLDCHRTWEALTLGAIPIVQSSTLDPMFKDMPVMVVKEYTDLTDQKLAQFLFDLEARAHSLIYHAHTAKFWKDKIMSFKSQLK